MQHSWREVSLTFFLICVLDSWWIMKELVTIAEYLQIFIVIRMLLARTSISSQTFSDRGITYCMSYVHAYEREFLWVVRWKFYSRQIWIRFISWYTRHYEQWCISLASLCWRSVAISVLHFDYQMDDCIIIAAMIKNILTYLCIVVF